MNAPISRATTFELSRDINHCKKIEMASFGVAIISLVSLAALFYMRYLMPQDILFLHGGAPILVSIAAVFVASLIVFAKNYYKKIEYENDKLLLENFEIIDTNITGCTNLLELCEKAHVIVPGDRHTIATHHQLNSNVVKRFWEKGSSLLLTECSPGYFKKFLSNSYLSHALRWDTTIQSSGDQSILHVHLLFLSKVQGILYLVGLLKSQNFDSSQWKRGFDFLELDKIESLLCEFENDMSGQSRQKLDNLRAINIKIKVLDTAINPETIKSLLLLWTEFYKCFSEFYSLVLAKSWMARQNELKGHIDANLDKFKKIFVFAGLSHLEENENNPLQTEATRLFKDSLKDTTYLFLRPSKRLITPTAETEEDFEETLGDYCPECPLTSRSKILSDQDAVVFTNWIQKICNANLVKHANVNTARLIHRLLKQLFLYEIQKAIK